MSDSRATGADDQALAETTWPLPGDHHGAVQHRIVWAQADRDDLSYASAVMSAYAALVRDGTTKQQLARLAALRRVYRKRTRGSHEQGAIEVNKP